MKYSDDANILGDKLWETYVFCDNRLHFSPPDQHGCRLGTQRLAGGEVMLYVSFEHHFFFFPLPVL